MWYWYDCVTYLRAPVIMSVATLRASASEIFTGALPKRNLGKADFMKNLTKLNKYVIVATSVFPFFHRLFILKPYFGV